MRDFNGIMVFLSIICRMNFTRVRCFLVLYLMIFSKTVSISSFICDCIKTSSKFVIAFFLVLMV